MAGDISKVIDKSNWVGVLQSVHIRPHGQRVSIAVAIDRTITTLLKQANPAKSGDEEPVRALRRGSVNRLT